MMQVVIEIPEEMWERVKEGYVPLGISKHLMDGTPLPKGHGRLIDADAFAQKLTQVSIRQKYDKLFSDNILSVGDIFDAVVADLNGTALCKCKYENAPTIIEADKAEMEDKECSIKKMNYTEK